MKEKSCSTCIHIDEESGADPCVRCRRTFVAGSVDYRIYPDLWEGEESTNDPVNHPSHYNKGKIEVADFIADQKLNFDRGNAVKYVCRAGSKDPEEEIQDLEKAIWYINHEIKMLKGDIENGTEKEN